MCNEGSRIPNPIISVFKALGMWKEAEFLIKMHALEENQKTPSHFAYTRETCLLVHKISLLASSSHAEVLQN